MKIDHDLAQMIIDGTDYNNAALSFYLIHLSVLSSLPYIYT
jgi:hypothetical protein